MDKNTNSTEESKDGTVETSFVSTPKVLSFEEVSSILLAVITLLDRANPEAKVHDQIIVMAEAIYEEIYKNGPSSTTPNVGTTPN
jgi:hypothetical protein